MRLINKLFNEKNDDYYTASNDTSILSNDASVINEKPIVNDKPDKVHNRFDKDIFKKFMLIIALLALFVSATFWSISVMKSYPNQTGSKIVAIVWDLLIILAMIAIDMRDL